MSEQEKQVTFQGGVGVSLGGSFVTRASIQGRVDASRVQETGLATLDTSVGPIHQPPSVLNEEAKEGGPHHRSVAGFGVGKPSGFGGNAGIGPLGVASLGHAPSPTGSVRGGSARESPRGFVAPGYEAPTEE